MFRFLALLFWMFWGLNAIAQFNRIIIDDQSNIISEVSKNYLSQNLASNGIVLDDFLDYEHRCDYLFITISSQGENLIVSSRDCNKNKIKSSLLNEDIRLASPESIANTIGALIFEMLGNEGKNNLQSKGKISPYENQHDTRYFFAPSAYNLKKGQLYYNTLYFLVHDVQYGINDNFSFGLGTTVGFFPAFLSPKYSRKLGANTSLVVGDLFTFGTYASDFYINLAYAGLTFGNQNHNITVSGGLLNSNYFTKTNAIGNISAMSSLSKYLYVVTENYLAQIQYDVGIYGNIGGTYRYDIMSASRNIIAGFSGIRVVTKKSDVQSVQFGFLYFVPLAQRIPFFNSSSNTLISEETRFDTNLILPGISYTLKFGRVF